jgi:hypothetical protein
MSVPRRLALALAIASTAILISACGGSDEPQDANEPSGEFVVEVTKAKLDKDQRLAETSDLVLAVRNTGTETLPELAFTIYTDDGTANGSFMVRSEQPGLAIPSRPVWVLENKYPRFVGEPPPKGLSGGFRAQTNTFGFGPLEPGETKSVVWRLTPVQAGTYTLTYIVEAGLDGNARAVTTDGEQVEGAFTVKITDAPAQARVNNQGEVVTEE